jgi:hypothetical protein
MTVIELVVYGWLLHFVADWFLQNEWMAVNKANRRVSDLSPAGQVQRWLDEKLIIQSHWWDRHPAAYVHAGIHGLIQLLIFPWWAALLIGVTHFFIDLRTPLTKWKEAFKQTIEGPYSIHVAIWQDQVAHLAVVALVAQLV